jgi:GP68-prohead core protein
MTTLTSDVAGFDSKLKLLAREVLLQRMGEVDDVVESQELSTDDLGAAGLVLDAATQNHAIETEYEDGIFSCDFSEQEDAEAFADALDDIDGVEEYEIIEYEDGGYCVIAYLFASDIVEFDYDYEDEGNDDGLDEVRRRIKVNSKGKRRIKMQCKPGFKWDGKACIKISGAELATKRMAKRKMVITKRAQGNALKIKTLRKTRKARRFRKAMGLK